MAKILQLFDVREIVVLRSDPKNENLIRITGVLLKDGNYRYRGTFTNDKGRPVSKIFNQDELKKIDK